ncbi:DUF6602 domain-containing protein [Rhizobium sp. AN80A]|uniref:DUF6602 domain-containing protein n=1 Tax=Rhizobium sp. AN80A TaxID=3040673 RepID=UPI0024B32D55|nr:DUF6602 domain-containing protein [Rhizobium sp. AN80A]
MQHVTTQMAEIYRKQEASLLARIAAVQVTKKPELIGAELENCIRQDLEFLVPSTLRVVAGFIVRPDGERSSHFDGIVLDARYPLIARVAGSALVPLHAVVAIIEIKTTLAKRSLDEIIDKRNETDFLCELLDVDLRDRQNVHRRVVEEAVTEGKLSDEERQTQLKGADNMFVGPNEIRFFAIALGSDVSDERVAIALWQPLFYDLFLLQSNPAEGKKEVDIGKFGPSDAPSRQFWLSRDPLEVTMRRSNFMYGYFLQSVIQAGTETLSQRPSTLADVEVHIQHYLQFLVEVREVPSKHQLEEAFKRKV